MKLIIPGSEQLKDGTYKLREGVEVQTTIKWFTVETSQCKLTLDGKLWLKVGAKSDGATGAINTVNTFVPAFAHDAIEGLVECGALPKLVFDESDRDYRQALKDWGVPFIRRCYHFKGLKIYRVYLAIKKRFV